MSLGFAEAELASFYDIDVSEIVVGRIVEPRIEEFAPDGMTWSYADGRVCFEMDGYRRFERLDDGIQDDVAFGRRVRRILEDCAHWLQTSEARSRIITTWRHR